MTLVARAISGLLDLLAPPSCAACGEATRAIFCDLCRTSHLSAASPRTLLGVPLLVAGVYAPPLSTAIVRFKYQGRAELALALSRLLAPSLCSLVLAPSTALVPVPLHPRKLAERGYNQAALLAQELAKAHGLPCQPRLLARIRETERQVGKARSERMTNADAAFSLRESGRPHRALLVDDVVTTGSTVRACAQALAQGGVELSGIVALAVAG